MARALSNDLRRRVVAAVMEGGMSRRGAAKRFGIAPSTAVKWVDAWRRSGSYRPGQQGGDRRPRRIEVRAAAVAKLRFLPLYSPDLNPIEMAFSKFKAFLKRRAARTVTQLEEAIAQAIDIYTPNERQNYFAAAGYNRK